MPIANIRDHRLTVAVADTAIPAAVAMMRATAGAAAVITRFRFSDASQSGTFVLLGLAGSTIVRISGAVTVTAGGTKLTGETTYDVQAQAQALTGVNAYYWLCTVAPMAGSVDIQTWEVSEAEGLTYAMANMELNLGNVGLLSAAEAEINPATLESVQAVSTPVGTTADVPLDSTTTVESATARTGVSLWKRAVNMLIALLGKFGTAGSANAAVMSVQGIGGGTTLPVTEASASGIATALGTSATTAVDGDAAGVAIAHLRGINKKLAAGVGVTGAVTTSGTVTEASAASILATQNLLSGNGLTRLSTNGTAAAAGSGVVVAALANRQYRLHGLTVTMDSSAATGAWDVRDSDGTVLAGPFAAPNQGGGIAVVLPMSKLSAYVVPTAAKGISIGATGANLHFHAIYSSETV